jgi:hypothetical protein
LQVGVAIAAVVSVGLVVVAVVLAPSSDDGASAPSTTGGGPTKDELQAALHRRFDLPRDAPIELGPAVPGVLVFHAYDRAKPQRGVTGAFDGEVHTDVDEATRVVLDALGFGRGETDPTTVAAAVGMLQGDPGTPFVTQFAIDQSGDPATMRLPRAITVDGRPAVEFWNMTARRPPWRSQVVARADGTYEVRELPPK